MYTLDTDHISLIGRGGAEGQRIFKRLAAVPPSQITVALINYEEQMRGWLAEIAAVRAVNRQETKYAELSQMLQYYCAMQILPFDDRAIAQFQNLWLLRLRVGAMDLKIAAIAIANNATLITRNSSDFGKIPGLHIEDWSV